MGLVVLTYAGGLIGQLLTNYQVWMDSSGIMGQVQIQFPDPNPFICLRHTFTWNGLKGMAFLSAAGAALFLYIKFQDKFSGTNYDSRGFVVSKTGTYGTASWMSEKDMKQVFEITTPAKAEGNILGEYRGKLICLPKDKRISFYLRNGWYGGCQTASRNVLRS